ncbi:hypothetical protein QYF61_007105 [Mycteria americana]|uniref:Uncharacterized protein n=1 Tax=Mycteria americana TaxID=33587 RepID=A0AAN7N6Z8_MYCAM|nr:hypothetical protein QYF61_007105 [Mycteria americana]
MTWRVLATRRSKTQLSCGTFQAGGAGLCEPHEDQQGQAEDPAPVSVKTGEWMGLEQPYGGLGLVDKKLDVSRQCALVAQKAKCILGYITRSVASRSTELWGPHHKKDMDLFEQVQSRATKMIQGLEHLSYEDRLRELGLLSLEMRRLWGDLIAAFPYIKGAYKKDGDNFLRRFVVTGQGATVLN